MKVFTAAAVAVAFVVCAGSAGAHRVVPARAVCSVSALPVLPYTNPVTKESEHILGGRATCRRLVPLDVRVCPQLEVSQGVWSFVRSQDGYGTCSESGWSSNYLTEMSGSYGCSGSRIRIFVRAWFDYYGRQYSATVVGRPHEC